MRYVEVLISMQVWLDMPFNQRVVFIYNALDVRYIDSLISAIYIESAWESDNVKKNFRENDNIGYTSSTIEEDDINHKYFIRDYQEVRVNTFIKTNA